MGFGDLVHLFVFISFVGLVSAVDYNVRDYESLKTTLGAITSCNNTIYMDTNPYVFNDTIEFSLALDCTGSPNRIVGVNGTVLVFPKNISFMFNEIGGGLYSFPISNLLTIGLNSTNVRDGYLFSEGNFSNGYFMKHYYSSSDLLNQTITDGLVTNKIPKYGFSINEASASYIQYPDGLYPNNTNFIVPMYSFFKISAIGFKIENISLFGCIKCIDVSESHDVVIDKSVFVNSAESIFVGSDATIQNCYFNHLGMNQFRSDYLSVNNNTTKLLFGQLFSSDKFSTQTSSINISLVSSINNRILYNIFDNCQGVYMSGVSTSFVKLNLFYGTINSPLHVHNSSYIFYQVNTLINCESFLKYGPLNVGMLIIQNIVFTQPEWRPHLSYYIDFSSIDTDDQSLNVGSNIFWSCYTDDCELSVSIRNVKLIMNNNIIRLGNSISSTISVNSIHNMISGPGIDNAAFLGAYCNTSLCINDLTSEQLFRNVSIFDFSIDSCFILQLEEYSDPNDLNYLTNKDWIGSGLGSSEDWFGIGNSVGAYSASYYIGYMWVPYSPITKYYNTEFIKICDDCIQVSRTFNTSIFLSKHPLCEMDRITACSSCTTVNFTNTSLIIKQPVTVISTLVVSSSNLTYQGDVVLNQSSTLKIEKSTLLINGSLSLDPLSSLTVVPINTTIQVLGTANFSGKLIIDFSGVPVQEFQNVFNSSREIIKFTSLATKFTSFEVQKPSGLTVTTGSINQNYPIYEFDLKYTNSSLILVPILQRPSSVSLNTVDLSFIIVVAVALIF
eukprot:TRINITY_DN446_c0_g2_i4.p1 TRINITY_DN446_c0_g2~~TRINITY_DN446_c0_g2_i4.p1  ORF type:complete len:783 (-),score=47.15 TRINITY_DN446_c0_g2_i4:139-2487(-)